ncbi:MAG: sensor histidine kinase, partial [Psychroflexus salarius]
LKQANKSLTQQDKLKDDFLDTVAHELKTPITSIQASSEILKDDADIPDDLKQQFLSNILFDTQRITNLINDILNLEKLASGRESLQLNTENVTEIIHKAVKSFEGIVQKKKISISIDSKPNEVSAEVDSAKLIQVFTNLISNSLKFVEPKHGKIEIKVNSTKDILAIEVLDNGKGLVEADIPYIFDKFYQSNNQTLKKPEGSGFGLAICKQIISLHKGVIEVNKAYTKGASFIIKLPKKQSV